METIAPWCLVDTRIGCLTCVLEENNCFDAEMYADEVDIEETGVGIVGGEVQRRGATDATPLHRSKGHHKSGA